MRWQKAQGHDDRVLERFQAVLFLACVYDEQEDWRGRRRLRQPVFDSRAAWVKLRWDSMLGDILVVRWEVVALKTEWTDPYPRPHVHLAVPALAAAPSLLCSVAPIPEGVEDALARHLTCDWRIL